MTVDLGKQQLLEGLTVFGDSDSFARFYVMPNQPRFRIDSDTKKPVFRFIKYKLPVDRPDGRKGGGFVVFDCEFVVPEAKLAKIQAALDAQVQKLGIRDGQGQPLKAEIGHIPFTEAIASIQNSPNIPESAKSATIEGFKQQVQLAEQAKLHQGQ